MSLDRTVQIIQWNIQAAKEHLSLIMAARELAETRPAALTISSRKRFTPVFRPRSPRPA